ncbi:AI-2E family transporter [Photobacterium ganghwense]|uniref:Hipothetical membrane protein n=1 Tax=Photobacterium ganghwense TaxID=320778 RepID=A0A0J1HAL5_9GAMM|nr:AI-2E family transporter [Photobacterium ganghwense]KLV08689.1 hipothetical membrane protein [Photobacterium ganghwense]PSU10811.1 AI-2E family transporter [Photobacterium ganghwense]
MNNQNPQHSESSSAFINNMVESAIRIGLLFVLVVWTYDIIKPFLIPVLWGAIIAVALMPVTKKLANWLNGKESLAATLLALLGVLVLIVPLILVMGSIYDGIIRLTEVFQAGEIRIPGPTDRIAAIPVIGDKLYSIWSLFSTNLEQAITNYLPQIKTAVGAFAGILGSGVITVVMSVISLLIAAAFMANAESMSKAVKTVSIRIAGPKGEQWASLIAATIRSVLLGVVGVAFIQAILIGAAFFVFGIPAAGGLTLLVFILAIAQLPALIIVLPVIIYVFSYMDTTPATIFTVWVLLAGLSDNILKPMLMGRGVEIPMPVILIGAIGGMLVSGIIGLFVGAVVLAIWYELFTHWVRTPVGQPEKADETALNTED